MGLYRCISMTSTLDYYYLGIDVPLPFWASYMVYIIHYESTYLHLEKSHEYGFPNEESGRNHCE